MAAVQYGASPIVSVPAFSSSTATFVPVGPVATEISQCAEPVTVTAFSQVTVPTTVFITVAGLLDTTSVAAEAPAASVILSDDISVPIVTTELPQITVAVTAAYPPALTDAFSDVLQNTLTAVIPDPAITGIIPVDTTAIPASITEVLQVTESAIIPAVATDVILTDGAEPQLTFSTDLAPADVPTTLLSVLVPLTTDLAEVDIIPSTTQIDVIPTIATDEALTVIPVEASTVAGFIPGRPAINFGGRPQPSPLPTTTADISTPVRPVGDIGGELRPSASSHAPQCGNGQVLSCCNARAGSSMGSLAGGLLEGLIGGNCEQVPINVIGANGILMDTCGGNQAACCTAGQNGLLDVPCIPVSL